MRSQQIADELRAQIERGQYEVGKTLPSYRALMKQYEVALATAQAAMRRLEREGYVTIKPGSGARVVSREEPAPAEAQLAQVRSELRAMRDTVRQAGLVVSNLETQLAELADRIRVPEGG